MKTQQEDLKNNNNRTFLQSFNNIQHKLTVPFITTTAAQVFSGVFIAVKADMYHNPELKMLAAFRHRYTLNNSQKNFFKGIFNIYQGNGWNYVYTLLCSLVGNNLAQATREYSQGFTKNILLQAVISGCAAGLAESAWTTNLVARELAKTTSAKLPNFSQSYRRVFPSLALRDAIGWIAVQAGAIHLEQRENQQNVSNIYKMATFTITGITAAILSAPADANLRRVYADEANKTPTQLFADTIKKHGIFKTLTAGLKPRIASVSPAFMAYGLAQYYLNNKSTELAQSTTNTAAGERHVSIKIS